MPPRSRQLILLALAPLALSAGRAPAAQQPDPTAAPDSQQAHKAARSQQARFELLRLRHLPWGSADSARRCDEIVGRFCLRHDDDDDRRESPPELPRVGEARAQLITHLQLAARRLPGDGWITAQLVRYLAEAGQHREAIQAADRCRAAEPEWCLALRGYARHQAGDYDVSDSLYAEMLQATTPRERCSWTDLSFLLEGRSRGLYRRLPCEERAAFEQRFWWLADPLYILPGNDRRTEHFSRRVQDRMQARARSAFGVRWGADLRELLLRYGWPTGWERLRPGWSRRTSPPEIISHHAPGSLMFRPPPEYWDDLAEIRREDWALDVERPKTGYAPRYASRFHELEHQLAVFPRGDSAIVVAAYELDGDTIATRTDVTAGLVLARDPNATAAAAFRQASGRTGALSATVPAVPTLFSLETLTQTDSLAARARYGLRLVSVPRELIALSDILILSRADSLPESLAAAIPLARGSPRARGDEKLGLYWEVFGLELGVSELALSLTLVRTGKGWLRQAAESIGLSRRQPPLQLSWQEQVSATIPVLGRSLALQLPDLSPGRYRLELAVGVFGRETLTTHRDIMVTR